MTRAAWRGPILTQLPLASSAPIRTAARSTTILPSFVGKKFMVHNGKDYIPILISEVMVGKKLGEFSQTRKIPVYKRDKKK